MTLLQPYFSHSSLSNTLRPFLPLAHNLPNTRRRTKIVITVKERIISSTAELGLKPKLKKGSKRLIQCSAVADIGGGVSIDEKEGGESEDDHKVLMGPTVGEEEMGEGVAVDYDWSGVVCTLSYLEYSR